VEVRETRVGPTTSVWKQNFGQRAGQGGSANAGGNSVSEPSTLLGALLASAAAVALRFYLQ
jgi:hypothetical protein